MVLGHSAFRPGLHVLLAHVADADEQARARVFLWHYLAANLGYAAGALFGEWAYVRAGWRLLFGGATAASAVAVMLLATGLPWFRAQARTRDPWSARNSRSSGAANMHAVWLLSGVAVIFWLTAQQAREFSDSVCVEEHHDERDLAGLHDADRTRSLRFAARSDRARHAAGVPRAARTKDRGAPSAISLMICGYVATAGALL